MFERSELQDIRQRADDMAKCKGANPHWKRTYEDLSRAADHLDAMFARCTIYEESFEDLEGQKTEKYFCCSKMKEALLSDKVTVDKDYARFDVNIEGLDSKYSHCPWCLKKFLDYCNI